MTDYNRVASRTHLVCSCLGEGVPKLRDNGLCLCDRCEKKRQAAKEKRRLCEVNR